MKCLIVSVVSLVSLSLVSGCASVCGPYADKQIIVADTDAHRVHLCSNGEASKTYRAGIGFNGVGKTTPRDARTLLGEFPLMKAKGSGFHRRLAFGKKCEKRELKTALNKCGENPDCAYRDGKPLGCLLGLHGPPGPKKAGHGAGRLYPLIDATAGCVGLGSNDDIDFVERWQKKYRVKRIVFLGATRTNLQLRHGIQSDLGRTGETQYAFDAELRRRHRFQDDAPSGVWLWNLGYGYTAAPSSDADSGHEGTFGLGLGREHGVAFGLAWSMGPTFVAATSNGQFMPGGRFSAHVDILDDLLTMSAAVQRMWPEGSEARDSVRFTADLLVGSVISRLLGI